MDLLTRAARHIAARIAKRLVTLDIAANRMQPVPSSLRDITGASCVSGVSTGQLWIGSIYQRDQRKFLVALARQEIFSARAYLEGKELSSARTMKDTLEAFAASLDTKAFKVVDSPSLIFLCGGSLDEKAGTPPSVRHVFYKHLQKKNPDVIPRILLAEQASEWYRFAHVYSDLLELEEHIAGLSSLILLFVESAGSIAELGAFSEVEALRRKLVVIIEQSHYDSRSFIKEGPLTLLEHTVPNSVRSFPWFMSRRRVPTLSLRLCREAAQRIEEQLSPDMDQHTGEQDFNPKDHGHCMLLIADIVSMAGALREAELVLLLDQWASSIDKPTLDKYLFLLHNLKIVDSVKYGHITYFLSAVSDARYMSYPMTISGRPFDRLRLRDDFRDSLPKDRDRRRVYKRYMSQGR